MLTDPIFYAVLGPLVILSLCLSLGWLLARGKVILLTERMVALAEELDLEKQAAALKVRNANELAQRQKRRADEQFKVIEQATQETAATWTMYRQQSIGAGSAQALLFRELGALYRAYNQHAKNYGFPAYSVPEQLDRVLTLYRDEHLDEGKALERRKALVDANAPRGEAVGQAHLVEDLAG